MIEVFNTKTKAHPNMEGRVMLLERPEQVEGKRFDLITSNLLLRVSTGRRGALKHGRSHPQPLGPLRPLCQAAQARRQGHAH